MILIFILTLLLELVASFKRHCDCGIGGDSLATRIYGGSVAFSDEYPWMAHLRFFDRVGSNRYGMCGGFLIDSRHVMTAAHCIMDSNKKLRKISATEVYLGIHDLTKLNTPHKVEKFFYPPDYNQRDLYNDIAVLRLAHPVNFTNKIRPICLPKSDEEPYKRLVVAGFGKLGANRDPSEVLMHVSVEYIPTSKCNEMVKDYFMRNNPDLRKEPAKYEIPKVHGSHMCCVDTSTGGDACRGDSGGALMYKNRHGRHYAVGIVSGAFDECGDPRTPGFYTIVRNFRTLIKSISDDVSFCDY